VRSRAELTPADVAELYALYDCYYAGGGEVVFSEDLAGKSHVIELREGTTLRGFSTLVTQSFVADGEPGLALFSGDTVIHHEYWGEQGLARAFCRFAGSVKARHATDRPLYWFLISKGYRTYRYLDAFAHRYFPHPGMPTPPLVRRRMEVLAQARFGTSYSRERGLVRFDPPRGYLRPQWCGVRTGLMRHPAVRYFLERNPGFAIGDELVCLVELAEENLRSLARREFVKGVRESVSDIELA
jgi:hypothetical protein